MDMKSARNQKPSDGALVRRNLLPGLSKFRDRSCGIMVNRKARVGTPLNEGTDPPSIAPSSLRKSASNDCASSAAKYLASKLLWSAHTHANVRNETSEIVVAWENLDNSCQPQAGRHAASPRRARAHPWRRFQNAPEYQESQMSPLRPGPVSSLVQYVYPSSHQGVTTG